MLRNVTTWMRRHPVRCVVYALLLAGAAWAGLTVRGILRGDRNALLTDVARAPLLRDFVAREFQIRYNIESVAISPVCGFQVEVHGVSVELPGPATGGVDRLRACLTGSGEVRGIRVGNRQIALDQAQFDWPKSISGAGFSWNDAAGAMISAASFTASPGDLSGSVESIRAFQFATVSAASAALAPLALPSVTVKTASAANIEVDADLTAIAQAQSRLQAAAQSLQAMGTAVLPLPLAWSNTARQLTQQLLIGAAIALLILKIALTRAPASIAWRIAVILAPFAVFRLLALTDSWLAIVIAAPAVAIALWALAYCRATEWQQRWEPAAIDIPIVLLALLLLVLRNWPAISTPQIPSVDRVTVAQVNVQSVAATVHESNCGKPSTIRVTVPTAAVANLDVTLNGSALKTIDIERASAIGNVQTGGIPDLRRIRYLPAQWKSNPPIAFCAAVTLKNSGAAALPASDCGNAAGVIARAAVDYTGESARFEAIWNGAPASVAVSGSASLTGAQIDDVHTTSGPVSIRKASAQIGWAKQITANVRVDDISAAGVTIGGITAKAGAPMPCTAGAITVNGSVGKTHYSADGTEIALDGATFTVTRPDSATISAKVHTSAIGLKGAVGITLPESDIQFDGVTSKETIPQTLTAQVLFATSAIRFSAPTQLAANLWTGAWELPQQSLSVEQQITSWIPPSIGFEIKGAGAVQSLASPFSASAGVAVRIPQLVPNIGPTEVQLNDLAVSTAWDSAAGLGPVSLSSGWNVVKLPSTPAGFQFGEITSLHVSTRGRVLEAPSFTLPQIDIPSVPQQLRFQFNGTPQAISINFDDGQQLALRSIQTSNLALALPDLKLASLDADTSLQVVRANAFFPVTAHAHITGTGMETALTEPVGATVSFGSGALDFALTQPLDSAKLLNETGFSLPGIQPQAVLSSLRAKVGFTAAGLASLDVAGSLAPGPLASVNNLSVSQTAPSTFQVSAPQLPQVAVSANAPGIEVALDGGKLQASAAAELSLKMTLASAPASPLLGQMSDAGAGLFRHAQKAVQAFGDEDAAAFPLSWDLDLEGGSPAISLTPATLTVNTRTVVRRIDAAQYAFDGTVDLHLNAHLAEDHLLIDVDAPSDIGAFGARWKLNTPVSIALRRQLLPGTGGQLFDGAFYDRLGGARAIHAAIGYGDALQFHTAYQTPFTSGSIGGLAQASIAWPQTAPLPSASIDSFATFHFRGLEAGAITLAQPYLEDRLDGDMQFGAKGFLADRLLLPQLLSDASRVGQLDTLDISAQVRSAADGLHLPGIMQASTGITLKPANDFIRLITSGLNLKSPPRALQYSNVALDFRVQQGQVQTEPVLLTLNGVEVFGVDGLSLDSKVRILWGGHGYEPAPKLRDLIYTIQRSIEP